MPIVHLPGAAREPLVRDWESMLKLILRYRLIPFFSNPIPGYSVEEHTPADLWFTEENLGPWDWKIDCLQTGDIVYGKYLWGGKAAFATVDVYRELMNWRRSLPKYAPTADQQRILDYLAEKGAISVGEVRRLLGVKKSGADAILTRLQMQTRVITGDISRVYNGPDLHYSGWQRSSFCTPEDLFEGIELPIPGYKPRTLRSDLTPAESLDFLKETVRAACRQVTPASADSADINEALLFKMLG